MSDASSPGLSRQPGSVRDAATILLLREASGAPFEIFMVKRGRKAAFMANAMVYPGGRLDEADCSDALAERCTLSRAQASELLGEPDGAKALGLLVAGVRETYEEAGLLLARRDGELLAEAPAQWRDKLNSRSCGLLEVCEALDLELAVDLLGYFAHWITPSIEKRRYDTRFLIGRAPAGQVPGHDGTETVDSEWLSPQVVLDRYDAGNITLAPPTYRSLLELQAAETLQAALDYRVGQPSSIMPQGHQEGGAFYLLLPGDVAFDPPGEGRNRFELRDGRWFSEGGGC